MGNNDPMIFNSEGMTFNQIKTSEVALKDDSQCPWIVAYVARGEELTLDYASSAVSADITVDTLANWEYNKYITNDYKGNIEELIYAIGVYDTINNKATQYTFDNYGACNSYYKENGEYLYGISPIVPNGIIPLGSGYPTDQLTSSGDISIQTLVDNVRSSLLAFQMQSLIGYHSANDTISFEAMQGQTIKVTETDKAYKINIIKNPNVERVVLPVTAGAAFERFTWTAQQSGIGGTAGDRSYAVSYILDATYRIELVETTLSSVNVSATISKSRDTLPDAPYDMICMPYSDELIFKKDAVISYKAKKGLALEFMTNLAKKYSSSAAKFLYDLQLVPYCPIRQAMYKDPITDDSYILLSDTNYAEIKVSTTTIGFVLYSHTSSFTFDIEHKISISDYKQESQTDMYRLCSPNYSGQFEFNAAMNAGVDYFNVDVTYKPYQPYIHINPNFKNLYGKDYNDSRGLICGGEFSLPIVTDAWESYQLANKNYEQIFSRQIQNMKVQQDVARLQDILGGIVGTGTSISAGGYVGSTIGGGAGAVLGGAAGAALSGLGGIGDYLINERLRKEQISYATDTWNYQLGNIQALPDSLSKTTAYTYNNKVFPILEYYTCTDREKNALNDKIKYNSMNVGRIGKIVDFLQPDYSYVKAKLIRLEGANNDSQYISEIANELSKGVFIK